MKYHALSINSNALSGLLYEAFIAAYPYSFVNPIDTTSLRKFSYSYPVSKAEAPTKLLF